MFTIRCFVNCNYLTAVTLSCLLNLVQTSLRQRSFAFIMACLFLLTIPLTTEAQRSDLKILGRYKLIELPFELENDFIVISVLLDNVLPLRFIVDTGAENTVLLEKEVSDMLDVKYRRTFQIRGADVENELTAYLATGIDLRIADRLLARNRSMLVLEENYFDFERITGTNIQGILGADFLMRFTVEFDFRRNMMILHEPIKYKPSKKHVEVPTDFVRNRAYLKVPIGVNSVESTPRRLLLDSGAGLSLLMHTFGDSTNADLPVQKVPAYIANGLGGSLEGSVGRSRRLQLGGKELGGVVTYFQPLDTVGLDFLNEREGIMGNRMLRRFNVAIDYTGKKVYFRPEGRRWKDKFQFDRSGMAIIAGGPNLRTYTIASIVPDSPADNVGIKVGDRIVGVNGKSVGFMTLAGIIRKLEGKVGKKIKIRFERDGEYTIVEFRLKDLI